MTKIVRWSPARDFMTLRSAMDRMFDDAMTHPVGQRAELGAWALALDVIENDDAYLVQASVPGVDAEDIDVTLDDNVLTIKAELKSERLVEEARYHLRERRAGKFVRSVKLPTQVDKDTIEATYTNGVLHLAIPKMEVVKPRRIAIKTNGQLIGE